MLSVPTTMLVSCWQYDFQSRHISPTVVKSRGCILVTAPMEYNETYVFGYFLTQRLTIQYYPGSSSRLANLKASMLKTGKLAEVRMITRFSDRNADGHMDAKLKPHGVAKYSNYRQTVWWTKILCTRHQLPNLNYQAQVW